ncbi:hypothetical protein [Variovorax sp. OK212]|uniref:hypothetical protein n=1 Tax=Variovorax sp. OK212 TaxID=1882775 RepID=UPI0035283E87
MSQTAVRRKTMAIPLVDDLLRLRGFFLGIGGGMLARWQVELLLVFVVPALQRILCWKTELTDSGSDAFAQLDVELNGSNPIFV